MRTNLALQRNFLKKKTPNDAYHKRGTICSIDRGTNIVQEVTCIPQRNSLLLFLGETEVLRGIFTLRRNSPPHCITSSQLARMDWLNSRKTWVFKCSWVRWFSVHWAGYHLSPLSKCSWVRWFSIHWTGNPAESTVLEQEKSCISVGCLINTEALHTAQWVNLLLTVPHQTVHMQILYRPGSEKMKPKCDMEVKKSKLEVMA